MEGVRITSGKELPAADPWAKAPDPKRRERIKEHYDDMVRGHNVHGELLEVPARDGERDEGEHTGALGTF